MNFESIRHGFRTVLTFPITIYQKVISPALPNSCIYTPSCSSYAKDAIMSHGLLKGLLLGTARILRCAGGLYTGGDDPVPERFSFRYIGSRYRHFWRAGKQ
ncbi:MAG TPA: membrane protein insertion efficiency factor YidD [Spirochaetia bacterium]|nr:membrane protein insertion efficiency factor YidD [Spirochaetia bacterium]